MSDSNDDDDYMSDKFLAGCKSESSLIVDRAKKRNIEVANKKLDNIKKQKLNNKESNFQKMNAQLQESLQIPISSENKGFQMLTKMGFKPGQSLGRIVDSENSSSNFKNSTEPIAINLKFDRGGLGKSSVSSKVEEDQTRDKIDQTSSQHFRERVMSRADELYYKKSLRQCQMSCQELDLKEKITEPAIPWFWPPQIKQTNSIEDEDKLENQSNESDNEDDYTLTEKVYMLTDYLRSSFMFCFWCGVQFEDELDLKINCPGPKREDH